MKDNKILLICNALLWLAFISFWCWLGWQAGAALAAISVGISL